MTFRLRIVLCYGLSCTLVVWQVDPRSQLWLTCLCDPILFAFYATLSVFPCGWSCTFVYHWSSLLVVAYWVEYTTSFFVEIRGWSGTLHLSESVVVELLLRVGSSSCCILISVFFLLDTVFMIALSVRWFEAMSVVVKATSSRVLYLWQLIFIEYSSWILRCWPGSVVVVPSSS